MLTLLHIGDTVGRPGRQAVAKILPTLKKKHHIDLVILNADNLAHGTGITAKTAQAIFESGVDIITNGDHIWDKEEAVSCLSDHRLPILRPLNLPPDTPGRGEIIFEVSGNPILILNLQGNVFMRSSLPDPFSSVMQRINHYREQGIKNIFLDFHAEATSEKIALRHYLDGHITGLIGTHTHVPTADAQITKKGTAYITDTGMVGPTDSVLGVRKDIIIAKFLTQLPAKHEVASGPVEFAATLIQFDEKTGKAKHIQLIQEILKA